MAPDPVSLQPLERGYLRVLRIRSALGWLVLAAMAAVADAGLQWRMEFPPGVVAGPVLMFGLISIFYLVPGRWRRWGYAFTGRELHVASGWLVRVHTIVPVSRVQHIDVSQGPIERGAGVATLSLHTAGTENSLVVLPGISRERAESIRDAIRARISDTPW
ncbi:PH domain-containing protein [Brevundimonas sp. R86498]|uniref:PH domain-containing protein n=1 Tax=Brevundimonas sp. R86498 TaxID=3093845 RepID=UPI0037CAC923